MKLFSRKAVAAVATTVALTTAGLSAPAFAEDGGKDTSNEQVTAPSTDENGSSDLFAGSSADDDDDTTGDTGNEGEGSSDDPSEIRAWVSVFTAVVGALSAAFVFVQKLTA